VAARRIEARFERLDFFTDWGAYTMRHRKGLLHYVEIAVLALLCIPIGIMITFVLSFRYDIPTPGIYLAMKLVPGPSAGWDPGAFDPLIPRLALAGFVNGICFYVLIYVLSAAVKRLRRKKDPAARSGRT